MVKKRPARFVDVPEKNIDISKLSKKDKNKKFSKASSIIFGDIAKFYSRKRNRRTRARYYRQRAEHKKKDIQPKAKIEKYKVTLDGILRILYNNDTENDRLNKVEKLLNDAVQHQGLLTKHTTIHGEILENLLKKDDNNIINKTVNYLNNPPGEIIIEDKSISYPEDIPSYSKKEAELAKDIINVTSPSKSVPQSTGFSASRAELEKSIKDIREARAKMKDPYTYLKKKKVIKEVESEMPSKIAPIKIKQIIAQPANDPAEEEKVQKEILVELEKEEKRENKNRQARERKSEAAEYPSAGVSHIAGINALSNIDIDKIMYKHPNYIKTVALDEIDEILDILDELPDIDEFSFIVNKYPSTKFKDKNFIGHWLAVWCSLDEGDFCVYDPLAEEVDEKMKKHLIDKFRDYFDSREDHMLKLKINSVPEQLSNSYLCGWFCIRFILMMDQGLSFKDATGFNNKKENEKDVESLAERYDKFGYI